MVEAVSVTVEEEVIVGVVVVVDAEEGVIGLAVTELDAMEIVFKVLVLVVEEEEA
jgi:hypothetical protein